MRSLCFAALLPMGLCAQQGPVLVGEGDARTVLVRGVSADVAEEAPIFQATWRFAGADVDPVMALQRTTLQDGPADLRLDELMLAAFGAYLDVHVHYGRNGVQADLPVPVMVRQLNGMVRAATEELGAARTVAAVSTPTMEQLERLCRIDWSQARSTVDGGAEQEKYLAIYRFVRLQREELGRQLRADLLPLASVPVLDTRPAEPAPGRTVALNSVCGSVFDENNFLCALDLAMEDTVLGVPDVRLDRSVVGRPFEGAGAGAQRSYRVRKRDEWLKAELDRLNERIDGMDQRRELWALRDRIEDLEGRMDDLVLEMEDLRAGGNGEGGTAISMNNALTVTVLFAQGGDRLDTEARTLLSDVFAQLIRNPAQRILISGYSDASGDPALNLALSERRAKAVRDHLLARGIDPGRMMLNFHGDARSTGTAPTDRRVEIEPVP